MGEESDTAETKDNYADEYDSWQDEHKEEEEALEAQRITEMRHTAPWRTSYNKNIPTKTLFSEPTWISRQTLASGKDVSGYKIWVGNLPATTERVDIGNFLRRHTLDNDEFAEAYTFVTDINVHNANSKSGDAVEFYAIMENQLAAGQGNNFLWMVMFIYLVARFLPSGIHIIWIKRINILFSDCMYFTFIYNLFAFVIPATWCTYRSLMFEIFGSSNDSRMIALVILLQYTYFLQAHICYNLRSYMAGFAHYAILRCL